jgi:branched-chain amino acid transport system permease protein
LSSAQFLYLVTLAALAGTVVLVKGWTRGRNGRALTALRVNSLMARTQGVDTVRLSVVTVGVSAAMAGLGGALNALVLASTIPDTYSFVFSIALLTGAVIGGIRSWAGAVIGAAYVVYLPQITSDLVGSGDEAPWSQVIYAMTLLGGLYCAPMGLAARAGRMARLVGPRRPGDADRHSQGMQCNVA